MQKNKTVNEEEEFIENLTHDSYIIQAGRITDVRYTSNLDKLLSIFEQRHFIVTNSGVRKEYHYQPDDENMKLITDILYEIGANPEERKEIEDEEEALRVLNHLHESLVKKLEEKDKAIEEKDKAIEEKDKTIEEKDKKIAELERLLRDK
jgi:hypothetical protein